MKDEADVFVEVENLNGEKEKAEIIYEIDSPRDNKHYVILSLGEDGPDTVKINVGYTYYEDANMVLKLITTQEEFDYVSSLLMKEMEMQ